MPRLFHCVAELFGFCDEFIFVWFSPSHLGLGILSRGIAREAVHRAGRVPTSDQWGGPRWPPGKGKKTPLEPWGSVVCVYPHNLMVQPRGGGGAMFRIFSGDAAFGLVSKSVTTSQHSPYI